MKNKNLLTKKLAAVVLAAAMTFSMTACGGTATDTVGETVATTEAAVAETTADTAETVAETAESTEDTAETAEISVAEDPDAEITAINEDTAIKVTIEDQKEEKKNDAGEVLITIAIQKATIADSGYDTLQKVLDSQSSETYELAQEAWGDMQAFLEDSDGETEGAAYGIEDTISMKRADDTVFSYVCTDFSNLGGAHPNTVYNSYNYDTKTGKQLALRDVVEDYDGLYAQVLDILKTYQEDQDDFEFFEDYEDTVKGMFYGFTVEEDSEDSNMADEGSEDNTDSTEDTADIDNMQWYLTDDALVLIFNRYDIAAYAYGPTAVKIPFGTGLVKEAYRK